MIFPDIKLEEQKQQNQSSGSPIPPEALLIQQQESLEFDPPSWDELKKPLVDLLLKFYNAEDQGSEFVRSLSGIIKVLCRWQLIGPINTQSLLNFIID